jgi:M3 family oligoendopeptidase
VLHSEPVTETLSFTDVVAPVPDLDALAERIAGLASALGAAEGLDECVEVVRVWDALRREVQTYRSLVKLRFHQDTADHARKAAAEAWDEVAPRWTELSVAMQRTLLDHPRRPELERALGAQAFALWESEALAFDPAIKDGLVTEAKLVAEYVELTASARLSYNGEELNLSSLAKYAQHADRGLRHGAERVRWAWFEANAGALDRVYDDLVRVRSDMARMLDLDDFVALGYRRMCRVDYGQGEVERLRAGVLEHVVPFAAELRRGQAAALGLDAVAAWDEQVHDRAGSPVPSGGPDWLLARAREMFDAMGPLGPFFRRMDEGGYLDLPSRIGKAGGGFCTGLPTAGMPFVFANFNGTRTDVHVFTHEMGHAFQKFQSRDQPLIDYLWPTLESAEIHSMSLEFLAGPQMERFFGADADRYRRAHLADALLFLPYGTLVDHFQHEVYSRPELTPAERHEVWRDLERRYLPWRDWGGLGYPASGASWQRQRHIYAKPFYYIDYVLAQTCALQFWVRSSRDFDAALRDYVTLCGKGGSAPFGELLGSAGLRSPFDDGCLAEVVDAARAALA